MGICSSGISQNGASPSPTNRQYHVCRDSACSSVQFCSNASTRKFIPRLPRNCDWVMGPYTDKSSANHLKFSLSTKYLKMQEYTTSKSNMDLIFPQRSAWLHESQHTHLDQQNPDHPAYQQTCAFELPAKKESKRYVTDAMGDMNAKGQKPTI